MDWILDNWGFVLPLFISVIANAVVAVKLQSAKKLVLTILDAVRDKALTNDEKVKIFDDAALFAKDVWAVLKGLTPWKSK